MRRLSAFALASVLAAATLAPASAANLTNNISARVNPVPPRVSVGTNAIGASNQIFTPQGHGPKLKPPVKKWVCGPIVNWDGTPHCHWVTH
jgi:hypothetical protein